MANSSRRQVLNLLATTPVAPWLAPGRDRARNGRWSTAIALGGFAAASPRAGRSYALGEVLEFAASLGFDGVELASVGPGGVHRAGDEDRIADLRRLTDAVRLDCFSLRVTGTDAFAPDATRRLQWGENLEAGADLARKLGATFIEVSPAGGLDGQSAEEGVFHLASSLRRAAEIGAKRGLLVAVTLDRTSAFTSLDQLERVLRTATHPLLRPVFDPASFAGAPGPPEKLLARLGALRVGYARLREGSTAGCLRALREGRYHGWIVVDPTGAPDPYEACARAKGLLDFAAR